MGEEIHSSTTTSVDDDIDRSDSKPSSASASASEPEPESDTETSDTFQLYDLRVDVVCPPGEKILCGAKEGDYFVLEGEMMKLPQACQRGISIYSLAAVLPLLPAKQRPGLHENDWMSTDAYVACPDPNCPSQLKITRTGLRKFRHGEVTVVPLNKHE